MPEKNRSKKSAERSLTFEEALADLEEIITQLEDGDLTLDRALELFERGVSRLRICDTHLKKAQGKITELLSSENGEYVEKVLGTTLESFIAKEDPDA